jgi:hypothetical protein
MSTSIPNEELRAVILDSRASLATLARKAGSCGRALAAVVEAGLSRPVFDETLLRSGQVSNQQYTAIGCFKESIRAFENENFKAAFSVCLPHCLSSDRLALITIALVIVTAELQQIFPGEQATLASARLFEAISLQPRYVRPTLLRNAWKNGLRPPEELIGRLWWDAWTRPVEAMDFLEAGWNPPMRSVPALLKRFLEYGPRVSADDQAAATFTILRLRGLLSRKVEFPARPVAGL